MEILVKEEEAYWCQRSRIAWLGKGNNNIKFFHAKASLRRKKNTILGIEHNRGVWQTEHSKVEEIIS